MLSNFTYTIPSSALCKKYKNTFPNFTPEIFYLSIYSSLSGVYTQVNIHGNNFSLGSNIGYSVVNFGTYINLPVTFYGSTSISFIIPTNAPPGTYTIQVVNLLYPTSLYSNIVDYTLS